MFKEIKCMSPALVLFSIGTILYFIFYQFIAIIYLYHIWILSFALAFGLFFKEKSKEENWIVIVYTAIFYILIFLILYGFFY